MSQADQLASTLRRSQINLEVQQLEDRIAALKAERAYARAAVRGMPMGYEAPMSDTPRTDEVAYKSGHFHQHEAVPASFARDLERESKHRHDQFCHETLRTFVLKADNAKLREAVDTILTLAASTDENPLSKIATVAHRALTT